METSQFNSAADLLLPQRQAIESIVGRTLESEDIVFLVVLRPRHEPTSEEKSRARERLARVFEEVDRYGRENAIDPAAADAAIDEAVQDIRSRTS